MAERWDERDRGWRDDRGYRGSEQQGDRSRMERGADEVRSWFGDDDAARRRQADETRQGRSDRDWGDRGSATADRTWDRTRDTMRDMTDRDRDGRRGFSEWNDNDRSWERSRYSGVSPTVSRTGADYSDRDRGYGNTSTYATGDQYAGSRWTPGTSNYSGQSGSNYTGQFAGRGPRGYKRGDQRILEDVCDRLTDDPRIDASDIEVQVEEGEVTLAGSVRSRDEKRYSEDVIERITGVRDVTNHLKVKAADEVLGTARSGSSMLGLTDNPPLPPTTKTK